MLKTVSHYIHFHLHILVNMANFCGEVLLELQHSQLSVLQYEEAYKDWFFNIDFRFVKLYLVKLFVDMPQSLEHFSVVCCMCVSTIHKPCYWMETAIHCMRAIPTVWKHLHSFCYNTGVWVLVSLTTSIDIVLHKLFKTFYRSVVNDAIIFCAYNSLLQAKWWQGSNVPVASSKLQNNFRWGWDINPFFYGYFCINGAVIFYIRL